MGNQNSNTDPNNPSPQTPSNSTPQITPPQLTVINQQSPQLTEKEQLGISQIANKFNKPIQTKSCQKSNVTIDPSRLYVSKLKGGKRFPMDTEVVPVPFEVILTTMNPELMDTLTMLAGDLKREYANEPKDEQQWKLHGNGFYINYDLGHQLVIITSQMIYKGVVVTNKQNKIVPDEFGMLLTIQGKYTGQFKNGKSHGEGTYINKKSMTKFEGTWEGGFLVKCKIVNEEYQFEGLMNANNELVAQGEKSKGLVKADGQGAIRFLKTGSSYTGNFANGEYNTANKDAARYKTLSYIYVGHFKDGKKEGVGRLQEFENKKKNGSKTNTNSNPKAKLKFRPRDDYDGEWEDDYFITTRAERQKKKIQDIKILQDAENKLLQNQNKSLSLTTKPKELKLEPEVIQKPPSDKQGSTSKTDVPVPEIIQEEEIQSQI